MKLTGIELRNFRSIGEKPVILSPLKKCNILVGKNNSGKSNVLRAIQKISDKFQRADRRNVSLTEFDLHRCSPDNQFCFRLFHELEDSDDEKIIKTGLQTNSIEFEYSWHKDQNHPSVSDSPFAHIEDFSQANHILHRIYNHTWSSWV